MTSKEFNNRLNNIISIIEKWNWWNEVEIVWTSTRFTYSEIIRMLKDYDKCTEGSKGYLISWLNFFEPIVLKRAQHREELEREPKMKVIRIATGKVMERAESVAKMLVEEYPNEFAFV